MSRQPRLVEIGTAFHLTARGNYWQNTFFTAEDRAEYLALLARHAAAESLQVLGGCLLSNHVHLLVVPALHYALARTMRRTQADYARRVNRRQGSRSGPLWQSRFNYGPVAGDTVWTVLRSIELNPLRARLVERVEQSPCSSASISRFGLWGGQEQLRRRLPTPSDSHTVVLVRIKCASVPNRCQQTPPTTSPPASPLISTLLPQAHKHRSRRHRQTFDVRPSPSDKL